MPLTIKPISGITAISYAANWGYYPALGYYYIWIAETDLIFPDDATFACEYSCRGFINTLKSVEVPKAHDCENLQLEGDLYDMRFIPGWKYIQPECAPADCRTLAFPAGGGSYRAVHTLVHWGESTYVTLVDDQGFRHCVCTVTDLNGCWCTFKWSIGPGVYEGDYPIHFTICQRLYVGSTLYHRATLVSKTVKYYPFTYATVENILIPWVISQFSAIEWSSLTKRANYYVSFSATAPPIDVALVKEFYTTSEHEWLTALDLFSQQSVKFGELHYQALSKIDLLDINGLAYLSDLRKVISGIRDVLSTLRGDISPKALSDLYLSYKYGLRLTAKDTAEIAQSVKSVRKSGVSATANLSIDGTEIEVTTTIRYKPLDTVFEDIYNFLRRWDLLISAENVWDLIPFSFVVDWLYDVGEITERLDILDLVSHVNIDAVYDSYIANVQSPASRFMDGITGIISMRRYYRKCHLDASFPLIVTNEPSLTSHWLEGLALIIQKLPG